MDKNNPQIMPVEIGGKYQYLYDQLAMHFVDLDGNPTLKWRQLGKDFKIGTVDYVDMIPYLSAPMYSERLNSVFGIENWDVDFIEVNGDKAMKCVLNVIFPDGSRVTKSGIGTNHKANSDVDKDKTRESDSLKRASVKLGIGAYLKEIDNFQMPVKIVAGKVSYFADSKLQNQLHTPAAVNDFINSRNFNLVKFAQIATLLPADFKTQHIETLKAIQSILVEKTPVADVSSVVINPIK